MLETMPQEIEVRYILPAIRRELAKVFINENNLSQKEAAKILGLTEAAVSQYKHSKRASGIKFNDEVVKEIRLSARKVAAEKNNRKRLIAEIFRINNLPSVRQILCNIHRSQSKELENCNICFDEGLISIKSTN